MSGNDDCPARSTLLPVMMQTILGACVQADRKSTADINWQAKSALDGLLHFLERYIITRRPALELQVCGKVILSRSYLRDQIGEGDLDGDPPGFLLLNTQFTVTDVHAERHSLFSWEKLFDEAFLACEP